MSTLILTCAGGRMMPLLTKWHLATAPDTELIGFDANPEVAETGVAGFSRVVCVPKADDIGYVQHVARVIEQVPGAVLIPGSDEEALLLASHQDDIRAAGGLLAISDYNALSRVSDKLELARILESGGNAKTASTLPAATAADAVAAVERLGGPAWPVVLKPSRGRGRRGVSIVSDHPMPEHDDLPPVIALKDIPAIYARPDAPDMAMPFVTGQNVTVDVLADSGGVVQIVVRKWLENWRFPFPGQQIVRMSEIEAMARRVVTSSGLHGLLDMDFIVPASGDAVLLEVNPRPSGSCVVSLAGGVPLLAQYMQLARGIRPAPVPVAQSPVTVLQSDLEK